MRQEYSAVRGASTVSQTYTLLTPVPALTLHVGIKLNERVSLPLRALTLRCENRTLPHVRDHRGEVVGRIYFARRLRSMLGTQPMLARSLETRPRWATIWHLWTVFFPRRSITGKLVRGRVWRRHDGRRWIYKRFVEYDNAEA